MKELFKKALLVSGVSLLLTACGPVDESSQESLESQQRELLAACMDTEAVAETAEHSCVHGDAGPYQSVTASPLGTVSFVDVSAPHLAYVVTLPAKTDSIGWGGSVMFMPEESGEYAFMVSRKRGLRIFNGDVEVARECRYNIPEEVCTSLRTSIVADLEGGVDYRLEFEAVAERNSQFTLVIEEAAHEEAL
ncbi:hypothetical protein [Archangium sp.]|uniref:hypothetical protein n=1 Tax=Archangium sp. TaxID=1872627 RepID=UPI00286C4F59|nr:hypothetical protein [Archangium sp.]